MMNQGGSESVVRMDMNSYEKHQVADSIQGGSSAYSSLNIGVPPTTGSKSVLWTMQWTPSGSTDGGLPPNSSYQQGQRTEPLPRDAPAGMNAAPHAVAASSLGTSQVPQEHASYAPYSSSTEYNYENTGYQGYYYGYQQQTNNTYPQQTNNSYPQQANNAYPQQVGSYQNSGAPYQPLTSFQNSGSYAGSTSYSSTYYNTGDYQTSGSYQSSSYSNQTTSWNDGNYANYSSHQYPSYTSADPNASQSSSTPSSTNAPSSTTTLSYEQQYNKQWADYYSQTASDVSRAPGTENMPVTSASIMNSRIPGGASGYPLSDSQPPPPGTTSWRQEPSSSVLPQMQAGVVTGDTQNGYWRHGAPGVQSNHVIQTPSYNQTPSFFQKPLDSNPVQYEHSHDPQKITCPQGPNLQFPPMHQVPQTYNSPLQTVSSFDTRRANIMQIPTNPRIASNLSTGLQKTDKDGSMTEATVKPAYISVSMPKSDNKVSSNAGADSMLKPGAFPPSLRAYVERALARCNNDSQKAACQNIMKEMITKASADGTLFTRDWDIEPLFPLPDTDLVNKNSLQSPSVVSSLSNFSRTTTRRTKSRWEPVPDEKLVENVPAINNVSVKDTNWDYNKGERKVSAAKGDSKQGGWSNTKFTYSHQQNQSKNSHRPAKKPRFTDSVAQNGDASSDSDKEPGLTAYYSAAKALADSPEERKRRESRSKRFDKGQGQRAEIKHFRPKGSGANLYNKRVSALVLSKSYEDASSRAVEDIDWDSLTIKGTSQDIEKRYLRLTSAPDPSTVRPEEVLEKALVMVLSSPKNYLYKCDQLKSIRQDLTVQRIRNELTVKVYETHARLALEAGDLPEYNQCQSQLKSLYAEGIKGCHMEFAAYNMLCVIMHSNNNRDLLSSMARLSNEAKRDEAVKHALAVRSAVTSGNYVLFFRLYKTAPNLNTCLMDLYVEKMRFEAVKCMSRSYRPTVPHAFISQVLGFTSNSSTNETGDEKEADGLEECEEWLRAHGACLTVDNSGEMQLDTKNSSLSLFMPEPEDAVSHGDAGLAVNDFLTRTS